MRVIEFDYDTQYKFAWIIVEGKPKDENLTVQCCFQEKDGEKIIVMSDCGQDWGMCSDANEKAFKHWGANRCMKALFVHARNNGFTVV